MANLVGLAESRAATPLGARPRTGAAILRKRWGSAIASSSRIPSGTLKPIIVKGHSATLVQFGCGGVWGRRRDKRGREAQLGCGFA